jgi:hypothetical protein
MAGSYSGSYMILETEQEHERFWYKVNKTSTCWLWTAYIRKDGYADFRLHGKQLAHRVSWQTINGPVPENHVLDHLCRKRSCVNPAHLEPVTQKENTMRGEGSAAGFSNRTHCDNNHEFNEANTSYRSDKKSPARRCSECQRIQSRKKYALRKVKNEAK